MYLVVGGLFVNHLLAKVGLFWLAGHVEGRRAGGLVGARRTTRGNPAVWHSAWLRSAGFHHSPVSCEVATGHDPGGRQRFLCILILLFGSLLEAAYLFRWFGHTVNAHAKIGKSGVKALRRCPVYDGRAVGRSGYFAAELAGIGASWVFVPLVAGLALYLLERAAAPIKGATALAVVLIAGLWLIRDLSGINALFAVSCSPAAWSCRSPVSPGAITVGLLPASRCHAAVLVGATARLD